MIHNGEPVIGIVGGMGPRAGQALYGKIIDHSPACSDQEHFSVVLLSFSRHLPDRTLFLQGKEPVNPGLLIARVIRQLHQNGAGIIGIPCNTSHMPAIYDTILEETGMLRLQLLHMPRETCNRLALAGPRIRRVGVMSTSGTHRAGLYYRLLEEYGYQPIVTDNRVQQEIIHEMIYNPVFGIKCVAGVIHPEVYRLLEKAITYFVQEKADAVIIGCTELSLAIPEGEHRGILFVDSLESLAMALVTAAGTEQAVLAQTANLWSMNSGL